MIFMKKKERGSISLVKIIGITLALILLLGIGAFATETQIRSVKITIANGYEMTVLTTKTNVEEILEDNNIILGENERVTPDLAEDITEDKTIVITDKSEQEIQIAKISGSGLETTLEEILKSYSPIEEKIVVEQVAIPYETITKDISSGSTDTKNRVIRQGEEGLKEVTSRIKYQNDEEIERTVLSEVILQEPVDKIVQVQKVVTSRAIARTTVSTEGVETTGETEIFKVTAYCSCMKCCGKTNGITASGAPAEAGVTVAAPPNYAFGTRLLIGGSEYIVEDRGGAIKGNRIDVYMNSHAEALAWGVKYLPVQVIN